MRVVYVAWDPLKYPRIGKIAKTLRKRRDAEFHVMIPKFKFVYRGGKIGRLLVSIMNYLTVLLQIFFIRGDIFFVANCPDILVIPLAFRKKHYILEYRSPWSLEVEGEFGSGPWVRMSAFIERYALKKAWIVTLTTSKLMIKVKDFGKPVFVIPNYPPKSFGNFAATSRKELRKRFGADETEKVVLYVGKLTRVEGADLLPKIIDNVLKEADVTFWIVGSGPLQSSLEPFASKFSNKVKLFGWQPHAEIPKFIHASDVCIAPRHQSPYSVFYNEEGVSKISEYMFFMKPIVACGIAESKEYLLIDEDEMAEGILKALRGEVPPSERRSWEEDCEKKIEDLFNLIKSDKL